MMMMMMMMIFIVWIMIVTGGTKSSEIAPPFWANPSSNPCASQAGGWQLIYWPPDGKCYKLFNIGAPCPETMELATLIVDNKIVPECRCPPGTAQLSGNTPCHPIFTRGSCQKGEYLLPIPQNLKSTRRLGICRLPEICLEKGKIFWPKDGKCYEKLTKGPCPKGELLTLDQDNLAMCSCSNKQVAHYWPGDNNGCYEHYSKGPCGEPGEIFLPDATCGCHKYLPHFHQKTNKCYPLGGVEPCLPGHHFVLTNGSAGCTCKPNHVLYKDGLCYRVHTRGPCGVGEMISSTLDCIRVPCKRGRLYFPQERTCYKIGSRGPCSNGQVVLYDHSVKSSVNGISYNGICGCTVQHKTFGKCQSDKITHSCQNEPGFVLINNVCYKLYTQGPCNQDEWLVARRQAKLGEEWLNGSKFQELNSKAQCQCKPGFKRISDNNNNNNTFLNSGKCQPRYVGLAKFLNDNVKSKNL